MPYVPRWPHKRVLAFASSCALMLAFAPAAVADSSTDASATDTAAAVVVASAPTSPADATTTVDPSTLTTPDAVTVPVDVAPDPTDVSDPYAK